MLSLASVLLACHQAFSQTLSPSLKQRQTKRRDTDRARVGTDKHGVHASRHQPIITLHLLPRAGVSLTVAATNHKKIAGIGFSRDVRLVSGTHTVCGGSAAFPAGDTGDVGVADIGGGVRYGCNTAET